MREPYLSVIVACYNVEDYIRRCLDSIANTTFPKDSLEVLMIDDESTDKTKDIIDEYAEKYDFFRALHKTNGGISTTRNYGMKHARGKYIAFVDGDDIVPEDAYSNLTYKARQNDSDVVVGFVERFDKYRLTNSYLHSFAVHDDYNDTDLKSNHDLLYDTTVWNKLYKRSFLVENNIKFIEGMIYEDIPFTLDVHLKSKKTSIIEDVVYKWRWRESSDSITQTRSALSNFQNRLDALNIAYKMLLDAGFDKQDSMIMDFMYKVLFLDIYIFIQNLGDNEEDYIYKVQEMVYVFLRDWNLWSSEIFNLLPIKHQIMYHALQVNDISMINSFTYNEVIGDFKSSFHGRKYQLRLPEISNDKNLISHLNVSNNNCKIDQKIRKAEYRDIKKGTFEISGAFKFNRIKLIKKWFNKANSSETITANLINIKNNKSYKVNIVRKPTILLKRIMKPKGKYNNAGYEVVFSIPKAVKHLGIGTWKLQISNSISNKYFINDVVTNPTDKLAERKLMPFERDGFKVITRYNSVGTLVFDVNSVEAKKGHDPIISVPNIKDEEHVIFNMTNATASDYNMVISDGQNQVMAKQNHEGGFIFALSDFNKLFVNKKVGLFIRDTVTNALVGYSFFSEKMHKQINLSNDYSLSMYYGDPDHMEMTYERTPFVINKMTINSSNVLKVEAKLKNYRDLKNVNINNSRVEMISKDKQTRVVLDEDNNDLKFNEGILSFNYKLTNNQKTQLNLLSGDYQFKAYIYNENKVDIYRIKYAKKAKIGLTELPFKGSSVVKYEVKKDADKNILLCINQPFFKLIDSKKSLRSLSYSLLYPLMIFLPLRKVMVFDSYWSSKFDSNERLMYEYVVKEHPEIKTVWIFNNTETKITGNADRVKVNSFKYWYYLAVAKYIIQNTNMPNRYAKRKGQIEVETLHGTFLKHMGYDEPHFKFGTKKIQNLFAHRNRRWDYLVVPSDYMARTASKAFNYSQKIIKSGFPRNDELYTNNNVDYCNQIKNKIGIPLDKKVILYAPTYRADAGFDFKLDLDKLQDKLSDEYVLLVRLHYFVAHSNSFYSNPGFVYDVSDYDNINDLYLIADTLVTDYSSVMFDFAHLKRPMIFYAYDKDWYLDEENRGVYLDYDKQMPGPIVYDENQLIDSLVNLNSVHDQYKEQLDQFYTEFAQYGDGGTATKQVVETVLNTNDDDLDQEPDDKLITRKIGHFFNTNYLQAEILNWLSKKLSKKNIVIFESFFGTQYSDNPKAIYEYMAKNYPQYKLYWNVNDEDKQYFIDNNIPHILRFGFSSIWKQARAKYWVTNVRRPFRWQPSEDTVVLQTWHGTPLKTLAADVMKVTMPGMNAQKYHKDVFKDDNRWSRLIAPNMYSAKIMQRAFRMKANQMQLDGYPRNDVLINHTSDDIQRIKKSLNIDSNKKVVLYAPTWRDNEYVKNDEFTAKLHLDLDQIKDAFGSDVLVLVRTHYLISNNLDLSSYTDIALDVSQYPDIADLYLISDVLITDYSSVMFDYATLKRPMIFFTYDLDAYANEIRGFYFDFVKEAPGPMVKTTKDVVSNLKDILDNWQPDEKYMEFFNKYASWMDGNASKRAVEKMLNNHSLEEVYDDNLTSHNLEKTMIVNDGSALWQPDKDFADFKDIKFAINIDGDQKVEVIKEMHLIDPHFNEQVGDSFALIKLNSNSYWVNIFDLRK